MLTRVIRYIYSVVLRECVVSVWHLTSSQCTAQSARQFCVVFTRLWHIATSDIAKEQHWLELLFTYTSRESLVVLGGALGLWHTLLPSCLSMVEVHPAKSVIFMLAVSCFSHWLQLFEQFLWLAIWHSAFAQVIFVFVQLSSCVMLGASVTVWYKRHGDVKTSFKLRVQKLVASR